MNTIAEIRADIVNRHKLITGIVIDTMIGGTPAQAIEMLVDKIGYTNAVDTIAELVNAISTWDGRISSASRKWARSIDGAADKEILNRCGIYSCNIHSAHVEQLARAMMEYTRG